MEFNNGLLHGSLSKTILLGQSLLLVMMAAMQGPAEVVPQLVLIIIFYMIGLASSSGVIIYPLARNLAPPEYTATALIVI